MYDGSAAFDLADAVYLGHALGDAGYRWYEEPMRESSINAYQRLGERVDVPLLVAETSDGAHMNTADFILSGAATAVRTSSGYKAGITGAMRIAHLADSFQLRAEVHGGGLPATHLCMAIPNTTFYDSLVSTNPARRAPEVDARGIYRERACSSLYTYCVYELRLSEDEAQRRARAAKTARAFPVLLEMLAEGAITSPDSCCSHRT